MGVSCSSVMQSAPFLGPMMAVTLAICLSYIHLERFRHRDIVRKFARNHYESLASGMIGGRESSTYWRRICTLAEEEDQNENANASVSEAQHNFPRSFSEKIYSYVFLKARDALFATVFAFIALALFIYWTGYLLGYLGEIWSCCFMEGFLFFTYVLLTTVIVLIILAASLGTKIVDRVKVQIYGYQHEINTLTKGPEMQEKARQSAL